uniref:hypothetical protein n=1 Tax=Desulforegula conservatrix TaxID=153026 RepID=UPI000554DBC8
FDTFGNAISTAIFKLDTGNLFNADALETLKRDSETAGETFIRVASLLKAVPEGIARLRTYMEQGLTEAEAFQKLEGQYTFVSGILGNALSEAMQQGVKAADFETFKQTFTTSLENQLKAAVAASFQQQILTKIITASFGSMADFSETMEKLHDGKITVEEFKAYLKTGVAAARAALEESEPLMREYWDIIELTPSKADAALEQAKAYATNVVSGAITSALQMGVDAADWNVFKDNIQGQLNAQLQTIVLNSISSSMIDYVMSSVLPDGGDLEKLNKDFSAGVITAEEYGSKIQALGTKVTEAIGLWEPVLNSWMTFFNVKPKEDKSAETAADLASQPDAINDAVETFNRNQADASLMLAFINSLVEKIPALVDNYRLLDAAIIKHKEGLIEYGSGLSELTASISGYIADVKDMVNGLASAAGEAAQKASDAAAAASAAAQSAADSAKSANEQNVLLLSIHRSTSKTADVLDRMAPDGEALQVRVSS